MAEVIIVADGNQSIFGFRGADPRKMIGQFRADYRPLEVTLRQNHRSVASIVNAAHALMEASGARELSRSVRNAGSTDGPSSRLGATMTSPDAVS